MIRNAKIQMMNSSSHKKPGRGRANALHFEKLESREVPATIAPYNIGSPAWTDIWVDPTSGDDNRTGASRSLALRSVSAALARIPAASELTDGGYRIQLAPGNYQRSQVPAWIENRWGNYTNPIMIQAADGPETVVLPNMDFFNCRHLYLQNITIRDTADPLHFASSQNILLRNMKIEGIGTEYARPQETLKVNQSKYVYLENCDISNAWDNAVDFVAVQYGHVLECRVSQAGDWAMYAKGGSAYLVIADSTFFSSGTGGFTAGQGTGYEFMTTPWLHYEAYDIKFVNNIVHDTEGAAIGVNGGYNVLFSGNTFYKTGSRSHGMEFVFGGRSVDGNTAQAIIHQQAGGWGPTQIGDSYAQPIPNKHVYVYNNILYNPPGFQSRWQHFEIAGPRATSTASNIPSPALADDDLRIVGNVIWNGPPDLPLGLGETTGGSPSNPTINETQLRLDNAINTIEPQFTNPSQGDFRPLPGSNILNFQSRLTPDFQWADAPNRPAIPSGNPSNALAVDRSGNQRSNTTPPGAYILPSGGVISSADLSISMNGLTLTTVGQMFIVNIEIANHGPSTTTPAIEISLPTGLNFISGNGGLFSGTGNLITAQLPSISATETSRLTLNLQAAQSGTHQISASVNSTLADPVTANNFTSLSINVINSTIPLPATSLRLTSGAERIRLDWSIPGNSVPAISGVRIMRRTDRSPTGPSDGTLVYQGMATSFTDIGLIANQRYFYRIDTFSGSGNIRPVYSDPALAPTANATAGSISNAPIVITNAVDNVLTSVQNTRANLGGLSQIQFYREPGKLYRPLIKFDLSQIPAGSAIESARISLYRLAGLYSNQPMAITIRALSRSWQEGNGTSHTTVGSGSSWLMAADGVSWASPGGDFNSTYNFGNGANGVVTTQTIPSFTTAGRIEFDITNLAKAWVSGSLANHGLAFVIETGNWTEFQFASSENSYAARRPQMIVTFASATSSGSFANTNNRSSESSSVFSYLSTATTHENPAATMQRKLTTRPRPQRRFPGRLIS